MLQETLQKGGLFLSSHIKNAEQQAFTGAARKESDNKPNPWPL